MTTFRTHNWPWFALAALVALLDLVLPVGPIAHGVGSLAAFLLFCAACIRTLSRQVRDDPERLRPVVREEGLIGLIAVEKTHAKDRQSARSDRDQAPPPPPNQRSRRARRHRGAGSP